MHDPHQVPPTALRRVCIDFDGTLMAWGELDGPFQCMPGAAEAVKSFVEAGFEVVIFTSRLSNTWIHETHRDPAVERKMIGQALRDHDIHYDWITGDKPPAAWYIDDRAITYDPIGGWPSVIRKTLGHG